MKQIIYIDCQVFQTSAWDRGMGKYSLGLLEALVKELPKDGVKMNLIFTKHLSLSSEADTILRNIVPTVERSYLDLPTPSSLDVAQYIATREANTLELDKFVDNGSQYDGQVRYAVLSLFVDEVCVAFPSHTENILLFYDLIPLFYYEYYGSFSTYPLYLVQFKSLMAADKIMTISQTVADELSEFVGIAKHKLCNINGGPIKRHHIEPVKPRHVGIPDKFILMTTGNDLRKNNIRAVQGFEEYRISGNNSDTQLIITSSFDDATRARLRSYSDHIIFTGNIPEDELAWLYRHTQALLFIPESEGLGLPILEAVEANKPVVCSKIGPFFEMSGEAFYYTNHLDIVSIAESLADSLSGYDWGKKKSLYPSILEKYQWSESAKKAMQFILAPVPTQRRSKRKIAIVGPDPAGYSAIGKLMQQMHPALAEQFEIDYYIEKQKTDSITLRPSYIEYIASARMVSELTAATYAHYDDIIYHIGNSEFHIETIQKALYLPGCVIIHDTHLDNIYSVMYSQGLISEERFKAEQRLDKLLQSVDVTKLGSLLNNQFGAFVHSDFAKQAIEKLQLPGLEVRKTVLAADVPVRQAIKLSDGITVGMAGIIHPIKGIELIKKMSQHPDFVSVQFEIFGMAMISGEDIALLNSLPNVNVLTNLSDYQFQQKLAQLDILVNYREEYHGETSLSVIEAMRVGVVPVVHDIGWYAELPDGVAVKIKSARDLNKSVKQLINNPGRLRELSTAARQYVADNFTFEQYVQDVTAMLESPKDGRLDKVKIAAALKAGDIEEAIKIAQGHGM